MRFFTSISPLIAFLFLCLVTLISCNKPTPTPEQIEAESKKANAFFDRVFDERLERSPILKTYLGMKTDYDKLDDISDENVEKEFQILKKEYAHLKKQINYTWLNEPTKISYQLFEYQYLEALEGHKFRFHNYPVNQMFGLHAELPAFMMNAHQIADSTDAEAYISRLIAFKPAIEQLIQNLITREKMGIIPPKFVFPMVIDDCKNLVSNYPFENQKKEYSALYRDFEQKLHSISISDSTKKMLLNKAANALLNHVKPAYVKLSDYLTQLEKKADTVAGVWKFHDGDKFYVYALKQSTTTNISPEKVFEIGLQEVARIQNEMRTIMRKVGFTPDSLPLFFTYLKTDSKFYYPNTAQGRTEYLQKATAYIDTMRSHLPKLFNVLPKAPIVVKQVESFREKSAGSAFYQDPAPDGSRPGTYYVNLYDMSALPIYEMEALAYHEGIPGHHMQLALAQETEGLPKFRKFNVSYSYTAYLEGWGLYSELIPKEIGFYSNPYSDFGRLSMELWRACRLVVDVGLHYKKWSREKAIDYLMQNTPAGERECTKSIERYIVMPAQATAYKIGMLKILELREKARQKAGKEFDIRKFHDAVLKNGAMPLDMLERVVLAEF